MRCIDSSLWVKICGFIQPAQTVAIARLGADAVGFICVRSSPRYVTPLQIRAMSQALIHESLTSVERVGVFVDATFDVLAETVEMGQLTTLQLHGQEPPQACAQIRKAYPDLKIIKSFRIRSETDLASTSTYEDTVDALLLDAYHPNLLGGTGKTLPWESLQGFRPGRPWILAGGLTPANVQQALTRLSPNGIDLSSGVELSPGNKSLAKAKQLFDALQRQPSRL